MSEPGGDPSSGISSGDALIRPERHPACRRREARPGFRMERENLCLVTPPGVKGQAASGSNREGESTEAGRRGGAARSSVEGPVMGLERRGCVVRPWPLANWKREEPVDEAKPFKDVMSWQRPNIGSRVTREGHARLCVLGLAQLTLLPQIVRSRPSNSMLASGQTTPQYYQE